MSLWIYLHFPTLQLDTLYAEPANHALIIVESQHFQVVQCNEIAKKKGIKLGMGLGSASALCKQLQVHPYDKKNEHKALLDIAQWLYMITSDIALFAPGGILLKVTNMLSLYGNLQNYWQTLLHHLDKLQLTFQFASGFSAFSAMLLAKSGANIISDNWQEINQRLCRYPLTATELNNKQREKLSRVGITHLHHLLALPISDIARRFDIELVNYIGRLMGRFKHPIDFYHPPEQFQSYIELLFDIEKTQWLEKPISQLLKKLERFLTLRNQVAYELTLKLHQRDKQDASVTFTSANGDYLAKRWMTLCKLTIESLKLDAPVQGLTLHLSRCGELESVNQDIFSKYQGQQNELELIGILQAKLGQDRVYKMATTDDPRPELSTRFCSPEQKLPLKPIIGLIRPAFMLQKPKPLSEKVRIVQGPERLVTGWWDGDEITRDYFIARSHTGRWLWVFRNQQMQWFLHGLFS